MSRILLVDDDASLLKLMSMRLRSQGYEVDTADSAEGALDRLRQQRADLVLSDLRMGGMDGLALFERIQSQWLGMPVIIMTAHGTIPDAIQATRSGVFSFLTKPIDKDELLHLQSEVDRVRVDPTLLDYVVEFANATRRHDRIQIGLSPRGSLALTQAARATALFRGRDYAVPEDILDNVTAVCAHRIITRTYLGAAPEAAEDVLTGILETLQSPA